MEVRNLPKPYNEGFKFSYNKIKKMVHTCELDKKSEDCRRMLKELNIDLIED